MKVPDSFPLRGIIGVISESLDEIDLAVDSKLQCVEIRADLLLDSGLSVEELMSGIEKTRRVGMACLVTLRHPDQGGRFQGSEQERIVINQQALRSGADVIDLEWGTEASRQMIAEKAPLILSYHDFEGMPDESELSSLTQNMLADSPLAVKVVPTASAVEDAARMLTWVQGHNPADGIERIGFAMGEHGACSRLLTTVFGGPVTYTSFGDPVAPGQIALTELISLYRIGDLDEQTLVTGVVGSTDYVDSMIKQLNQEFQQRRENRVAIGFPEMDLSALNTLKVDLRIDSVRSET